VGLTPIEYRPWEGKRADYYRRFLVISKNVFRQKLKSKWVLAILIIGVILTHVFSIIFSTVIPHEELTPEMMVGEDPEESLGGGFEDKGGNFEFRGIMSLDGSLFIDGHILGWGTLVGNGRPLSGLIISDEGFLSISGTVVLNGELNLAGLVAGAGSLVGDCTIYGGDFSDFNTTLIMDGTLGLFGFNSDRGSIDIDGHISGNGTVFGDGTPVTNTTITDNGTVSVTGTMTLDGGLQISGNVTGNGVIDGSLFAMGFGVPDEKPDGEGEVVINERQGGYLKNGLLVIFSIMLASLVCADLIASDLGDNSFIMFFSRPIKTVDYLAGKIIGALWILGLFSFLPLMIFCIAVIGTQSGSDYGTSLNVFGSTILAGLLTTFIFVPYGIFISSMTKRKTYATLGIFMSFFVLIIIGAIFSNFDKNWALIAPINVLNFSYDALYGYSVPEGINGTLLGVALFLFMVVPLVLVYLRIHLKAVGK
jgi:ABC-type transport system involved in multi-copper enzyme maturation permease subunit